MFVTLDMVILVYKNNSYTSVSILYYLPFHEQNYLPDETSQDLVILDVIH